MTNGFWTGGASELAKAIAKQREAVIGDLRSRLNSATDESARAELVSEIQKNEEGFRSGQSHVQAA